MSFISFLWFCLTKCSLIFLLSIYLFPITCPALSQSHSGQSTAVRCSDGSTKVKIQHASHSELTFLLGTHKLPPNNWYGFSSNWLAHQVSSLHSISKKTQNPTTMSLRKNYLFILASTYSCALSEWRSSHALWWLSHNIKDS